MEIPMPQAKRKTSVFFFFNLLVEQFPRLNPTSLPKSQSFLYLGKLVHFPHPFFPWKSFTQTKRCFLCIMERIIEQGMFLSAHPRAICTKQEN